MDEHTPSADAGATQAQSRHGYRLSARWAPGAVERRDTESGRYEAINAHVVTQTEIRTQRALLAPVDQKAAERIRQAQQAERVEGHAHPFVPCEIEQ